MGNEELKEKMRIDIWDPTEAESEAQNPSETQEESINNDKGKYS